MIDGCHNLQAFISALNLHENHYNNMNTVKTEQVFFILQWLHFL